MSCVVHIKETMTNMYNKIKVFPGWAKKHDNTVVMIHENISFKSLCKQHFAPSYRSELSS